MSDPRTCREILEAEGADILDVGCAWHQPETPLTLSEKSDIATGFLLMVAQVLLLWILIELARERFKPPSN